MAGGRVCLGQIGAPHGVRGEVRLHSFTAEPEAIASYGPLQTEDGRVVRIANLRPAKHGYVARLAGVRDRAAAAEFVNARLYVSRERLPELQAPDEFYHADLIGLHAVDRVGKQFGTVVAIHNFGAGDIIELRPAQGGATQLLPFDVATVPEVNVSAGKIVVTLSLSAGEDGEAKPSRVRAQSGRHPHTRNAAGSRRRRTTLSRKGSG